MRICQKQSYTQLEGSPVSRPLLVFYNMHTKPTDLIITSVSLIGIEILGAFNAADASQLITTACQVAIAAATVYRLIKDHKNK
tara:strand:+ start:1180 stop:1428 length:249 start_codon:yes stop_codon:yes gene_type:complete